MATLGVVNFSDKINVLQQSSLENYSDQSNKRQIIFLRANPNTTPSSSNSDILLTNSSSNTKKKSTSTNKTMTRIHNPPPVAVARRNARERNRVKQVNNGFATLRQHIPTNIAAAYESGNGRGSNKKLSKVETLRMAVEYIKSLEKLLNLSDENTANNNSASSVINYSSSISPNSSQFNSTYAYSTGTDDDDDLRSPRNHIIKKNNYQLLYEDEENIHPLKMEQMEEHLLQESSLRGDLELTDSHDMALLNSIDNNTSLSPEVYSEHSLSPGALDHDTKSFIPVFNVPNNQNILPSFSQIAYDRLPQVKSELLSPNGQQFNENLEKSEPRVCIITRNEVVNEHEAVIDVMWWDSSQQQR